MPFAPVISESADVREVRSHLGAAGQYLVGLRRLPEGDRGANYADDVRSAMDFIHQFDHVERALTASLKVEPPAAGTRGPSAAFGDISDVDRRSAGARFVDTDGYREFAQRGGIGMYRAEVRALLTGYDDTSDAGLLRPVGQPQLPPQTIRRQRLFVRDLLSVVSTGLASVPYIQELNAITNETGALNTAEGSAKAEVTMQFQAMDAPIRKITAWIPATTEILSDAPTLRGYIDTRLEYMIKLREEQQILKGDASGAQLRGITETVGTQTQTAVAGDVPATFAGAIGKIENVDGDPDGIAMNPLDYWGAVSTRHTTQFDNGFGGNAPAEVPAISWGLPVVRTRSLVATEAIVGSWRLGATVLDREGVSIVVGNQHSDFLIYNKVAIVAEERVGLAVHRPDFFVETTLDLTA